MDINTIVMSGIIKEEPIVSKTKTGIDFIRFKIGNTCSRTKTSKECIFDMIFFAQQGHNSKVILQEGSKVLVQGSLEISYYKGEDGKWNARPQVLVSTIDKIEMEKGTPTAYSINNDKKKNDFVSTATPYDFEIDDEELPF